MNKNFYFLSSLPRAGNTLLASLLNDYTKISLTPNSLLADILLSLYHIKHSEIYNNFPDKKSFNNIYQNIFNNYYSHWKNNHIIDRAPWGTEANLILLKEIYKNPKFIILYRPVEECLASLVKVMKPYDLDSFCAKMLNHDGVIGKSLLSINNLISSKKKCLIIKYNDLVSNPVKQIEKIHKHINIPFEKFKIKKINQLSINDVSYDDSIYDFTLHNIRVKNISKDKYKISDYLTKDIIKKCKSLNVKL